MKNRSLTSQGPKGFLKLACALLVTTLISGCPKTPNYEDPVQALERTKNIEITRELKNYDIGVLLTDSTRKAFKLSDQARTLSLIGGNIASALDSDQTFVLEAVKKELDKRFRQVHHGDKFEEIHSIKISAIAYLDIQTKLGAVSGDKTSVAIEVVFVDGQKNVLERLRGAGESTIPYPAFTFEFQTAASYAAENLGRSIDNATKLVGLLSN